MKNESLTDNGSFFDHLEELRLRIIYVIIWFFFACIIAYVLNNKVLRIALQPLLDFQKEPVFISPAEPFFALLKLVIFSGFFLTFPFFIYQIYLFVKPALSREQTRIFAISSAGCVVLFYAGFCSGYFFLVPCGLRVLVGFAGNMMQPMITIGNYLNFFIWMNVILGIFFQIPAVMFFLGYTGIIDIAWFRKMRRFVYVGILILAALITPTTDAITLAIVSGFLFLLYEITLVLLTLITKRK